MASRATVPTTKEESLRVMDTNWLRNELIRIVKEAKGREEGRGKEGAAFNERAQFTIGRGGALHFRTVVSNFLPIGDGF